MSLHSDDFDRASVTPTSDHERVDDSGDETDYYRALFEGVSISIPDFARPLTEAEQLVMNAVFMCAYEYALYVYRVRRAEIFDDFRVRIVAMAVSTWAAAFHEQVPNNVYPSQTDMLQHKMVYLHRFLDAPMPMDHPVLFSQGYSEEEHVTMVCPVWEGLFSTGRATHNIFLLLFDILRDQDVSGARLLSIYRFYLCTQEIDGAAEVSCNATAGHTAQSIEELIHSLEDAGEFDSTWNWITIAAAAFMRLAALTGITLTARDLLLSASPTLQLLNGLLQEDEILHTNFSEMASVITASFIAAHLSHEPGHVTPPVQCMLEDALAHRRVDYLLLDVCAGLADCWTRRALFRARAPLILIAPFIYRNHQLLALILAALLCVQDHVTPTRAKDIATSSLGRLTVQMCTMQPVSGM